MKKIILICLFLTGFNMAQDEIIANRFYETYDTFKQASITHKRLKHSDLVTLISEIDKKIFN